VRRFLLSTLVAVSLASTGACTSSDGPVEEAAPTPTAPITSTPRGGQEPTWRETENLSPEDLARVRAQAPPFDSYLTVRTPLRNGRVQVEVTNAGRRADSLIVRVPLAEGPDATPGESGRWLADPERFDLEPGTTRVVRLLSPDGAAGPVRVELVSVLLGETVAEVVIPEA